MKTEAQGGMGDCTGSADTMKEAMEIFNIDKDHGFDYIEIWDMHEGKKIWSLDKEKKEPIVINHPGPRNEILSGSEGF